MININNDDISVTSSNKTPAVAKVTSATAISSNQETSVGGNNLPADTAGLQRESSQQAGDNKKLDEVVKTLNDQMQVVKRELHFSVDKESGATVIKVMDLSTKEVIRQIPNEEALTVARTISDGEDIKLFSSYT